MSKCAHWDHRCKSMSFSMHGNKNPCSENETEIEEKSNNKSNDPYTIAIWNAVLVAIIIIWLQFKEANVSDQMVDWDKIPYYVIIWLTFFTVISIMMDQYAKTLKDEKDEKDMEHKSFKTIYWSSAPIYAVIAVCLIFVSFVISHKNP